MFLELEAELTFVVGQVADSAALGSCAKTCKPRLTQFLIVRSTVSLFCILFPNFYRGVILTTTSNQDGSICLDNEE